MNALRGCVHEILEVKRRFHQSYYTASEEDSMAVLKGGAVFTAIASLAAIATPASATVPAAITPEYLATAGNSSLFTRWRPRSHYLSPHSWMNDPCGAVYDPATGTYHLHYQFHPNHVNWGNISWGHAVSKDLFHWTDVRDWANDSAVSLASGKYAAGPLSQFTGTTQPVNLEGVSDGTLLTFGTGIHALPTNWKQPYITGTEVQALYTSADGGSTWEEVGTVISSPPEGWNVTGWRDPSFFPSKELDSLLQVGEPHYYMVLGSGLKTADVPAQLPGAARPGFIGPRVPLYSAPASNLTQWTFLGALWEPAANTSLGEPDVTGSYGYNFEVSSFFDLPVGDAAGAERAWFVTAGAEGGNTTQHWREQWAIWNRGDVARRDNGSVEFTPNSGAALDWGISYAQATWADVRNNGRRIMWGWANEDILPDYTFATSKQLGYMGSMNLPMELYIKETKGVQNCGRQQDGSLCIQGCSGGGATAQTLGIRPLPDVIELLREGAAAHEFQVGELVDAAKSVSADLGTSYELTATLSCASGPAGIVVGQSPDDAERTTIVFDPAASQIRVHRDRSSLLPNFNNATFVGHFEPYQLLDKAAAGGNATAVEEDLNFHVVLDGSLLEIWVNERFALTARIYPSRNDSTGLSFFAGDAAAPAGAKATWKDVKVWAGLAKAWPERPDDTSVPLVWDTPEQTNNYAWWAGY
ncbi:Sucrose-6-phosphate hydrolase [Colletotrichum higginsianum IMI 349063]|uniref:Sucrose-6-phosphate hydrolase n=2 Tax=Colletotrichum higginsianum TaxID=80884 RepID=A0A1B7XU80_COLHI|nr:Sucrose-6-phosphate hydrolase [Colletotrichum higginsianum IMI 349063]OBR03332.1 Sucrose-6-phosphate hydrolase [Colletotrichum higginsianum IMI 349063]TIC90045.1 Levanase [Colletotrichum higginsianum]GJD02323.1 sucrose-6-phosphate hydrolase [Colletotrichum higginsianum]